MQIAKPQWHLLSYVLPPIFSSLVFLIFFPVSLFPFLVGIAIVSLVTSIFIGLKALKNTADGHARNFYRWLFSLFGLIFLLAISAVCFIFLTAASQLSAEKISFGEIIKIWDMTFFAGMCCLFAQLIFGFIHVKKNNSEAIENTKIGSQIFMRLSGLVVLVVSLCVVIFSVASGLTRWIGFQVPTGLQLQTMIASTCIYLPFITKRWRKQRFLKSSHGRSYRFFRLMVGLILAITLISVITFPFTGAFVPVPFIDNGLATFQWELFILAWWVGITPLIANQITALSGGRSLSQVLVVCIIFSAGVYLLCTSFLLQGGQDYFLAVVREGILALILTALPIAILVLRLLPFQRAVSIRPASFVQKKIDRKEQYLTHSIIQATVIACVLYWVSGVTLLFLLLLIVAIPRLMMFLFVDLTWMALQDRQKNYLRKSR